MAWNFFHICTDSVVDLDFQMINSSVNNRTLITKMYFDKGDSITTALGVDKVTCFGGSNFIT